MISRKHILALSLLIASPVQIQADVKDAVVGVAAVAGITAGTIATSHAYGWVRCWLLKRELYGSEKQKRTWNILEEIFPTSYEMVADDRDDVINKIKTHTRMWSKKSQTDFSYLFSFVETAQKDLQRLEAMKTWLKGDGWIDDWVKKARNKTFYYALQESMQECYDEAVRYYKRLNFILRVATEMPEYKAQLAQKENAAKLNYTASF